MNQFYRLTNFLINVKQFLAIYRLITKICDMLKCLYRHRSKSIWVTSVFFCQNDSLIGESLWPKYSLVTLLLFELYLFWYLAQSQSLSISLYLTFTCGIFKRFLCIIHITNIQVTKFKLHNFSKQLLSQLNLTVQRVGML